MRTAATSAEVCAFPHRVAGICGLLFVVLALAQNVIRGAGGPPNGIPVLSELQFATDHSRQVALLLSMFVIGMISLYPFSIGVYRATAGRHRTSAYWAGLGVVGTIFIGVFFSMVNLTEALMAADSAGLAHQPVLTRMIWNLHNAAFAINLAAIALALFSFSRALVLARMIPRWLWLAGAAGSFLLFIAAVPVLAEANGSLWFAVGVPGFLCWLLIIVVASVAMFRLGKTQATDAASSPT